MNTFILPQAIYHKNLTTMPLSETKMPRLSLPKPTNSLKAGKVTEDVRFEFKDWLSEQDFQWRKAYCFIDNSGKYINLFQWHGLIKKSTNDTLFR